MDAQSRLTPARDRTICTHRLAIAGLAGLLVLLVAGGQSERPVHDRGASPQYTAGSDRLYRVHADGRVEYLLVDFAHGTVEGIPGWAPVSIDHQLTRDRMGNVINVPRR